MYGYLRTQAAAQGAQAEDAVEQLLSKRKKDVQNVQDQQKKMQKLHYIAAPLLLHIF